VFKTHTNNSQNITQALINADVNWFKSNINENSPLIFDKVTLNGQLFLTPLAYSVLLASQALQNSDPKYSRYMSIARILVDKNADFYGDEDVERLYLQYPRIKAEIQLDRNPRKRLLENREPVHRKIQIIE
jgi:hypothetical protein